jgi:hypothetical protein
VAWDVGFHDDFVPEFEDLPADVRREILARARLLAEYGPRLGRPHADTLKGSAFPNMKELRFRAANGVWRVAYAFDPARRGVLLVAGDKGGVGAARFYRRLIEKADRRFAAHLGRSRRT